MAGRDHGTRGDVDWMDGWADGRRRGPSCPALGVHAATEATPQAMVVVWERVGKK